MKKNTCYCMTVTVLVGGLANSGCSKQTINNEVDGKPVTPGWGANSNTDKVSGQPVDSAVSEPKPEEQTNPSDPGPAGKYTIKEIMQESFKKEGNLKDLILEDMATNEQKAKFIDYVENLSQFKPRKGDAASWKEKTTVLIASAKGSDLVALKKATNCKACHSVHKIYPPKKK